MWSNFFAAGGWGMYPTIFFGFFLLAACALFALRRDGRHQRVAVALGVITFASGLLGTSVGICNSVHYLDEVPEKDHFIMLVRGVEESLHNLILALIIIVFAGIISVVANLRRPA
jgi:hypothetical protein